MNETFENSDIEKLASMVAREFGSVRADMEQGFAAIREEMAEFRTEVDERFNGIEQQLESMRAEIRSIREQLERLEEKSIPLAEQDELWQRIRRIEDKLGLPHELAAA
jgi:archaellum component FlaC